MSALGKVGRFGDTLRTAVGSAASGVGSVATGAATTVAKAVTAKPPAEKLQKLLADNLTLIDALPADTPNGTGARTALRDRQAALLVRVTQLGAKPKKDDVKSLRTDVDQLSSDVSAMGGYAIARGKAQALEREVSVLNRDTTRYQQPITDLLTEADGQLKTDPAAATTTLKKADAVAKRQKATAGTQRDQALADAREKPLFEDKVRRIRAAIKELEALPGTARQRDGLNALIRAGMAEARPGHHGAAYKALKGLSGLLAEGRKASEGFPRQAGGPEFEKQWKATEATFETYSALSAFADPPAVAKYRSRIDAALKTLEVQPTPAKSDAASAELLRIDGDMKASMAERQKDAADWDRILPGVDEGIALLRKAAPADVYGGFLATLRSAQTLHGLQDHQQAVRQLRKLRSQVNKDLPTYQKPYEDWLRLAKIVDDSHLADLQRIGETMELDAIRGPAGVLLKNYATAAAELPHTHQYADGVVHAQAVVDSFPVDIAPMLAKYDAVAPRRANGDADLRKAGDELQAQIDLLSGKGGDVTASTQVIATARNQWSAVCRKEIDPKVLADAFVAAVKLVNDEKARLIKLLADPALLKASQDDATKATRQAQLDSATRTARARLQTLGEDFPADVGAFQDLLDAILRLAKAETDAGRPVMQKQVDDLSTLLGQIDAKLQERRTAVAAQADSARQAGTALIGRVNALRKANAKFVTFFDALDAEVKDAAAMAGSTVAKVVAASLARLTAGGDLFERVKALESSTDFDLVVTIGKDIDKYLDSDAIKTCKPAQRKAFQTRLAEEVMPDAHAKSPTDAVTVLRDFRKELQEAHTAALAAMADRERIKALVASATTELEQLDKAESPKVHDSLVARIKAAGHSSEGREYDSISRLQTLIVIIKRLASGTPEATAQLVDMEKTLVSNEFKEEQAKAQWEAQIGLYEKNELRQAKLAYDAVPGPMRDAPRMQQLTDLEKDGRKLAGKGQYREALLRLEAARSAARSLQASPMHADASARGELKAAAGKWKAAIGNFVTQLNDLADTIRKQAADDATVDPAAPDLAAKAVREIAASFDPLKFDSVIEGISADGVNLTQRRQGKEIGLRFIRNYLDTLESDPLLKHVAANPFKPVALKTLRDRLNDLNLNFQRAG